MKYRIFIASSSNGLSLAREIKKRLESDNASNSAHVWETTTTTASRYSRR